MKALIIHNVVHSTFPDDTFTPEQEATLPTWNNGNPAPDALVVVPPEWEPYIDSSFRWTEADGLTEPEPGYVLGKAKAAKLVEFDAEFAKLDALKIRPTASIIKALAAGEVAPQDDAARLLQLEAVTTDNRVLRERVQAADNLADLEAIAVNTGWPSEADSAAA